MPTATPPRPVPGGVAGAGDSLSGAGIPGAPWIVRPSRGAADDAPRDVLPTGRVWRGDGGDNAPPPSPRSFAPRRQLPHRRRAQWRSHRVQYHSVTPHRADRTGDARATHSTRPQVPRPPTRHLRADTPRRPTATAPRHEMVAATLALMPSTEPQQPPTAVSDALPTSSGAVNK